MISVCFHNVYFSAKIKRTSDSWLDKTMNKCRLVCYSSVLLLLLFFLFFFVFFCFFVCLFFCVFLCFFFFFFFFFFFADGTMLVFLGSGMGLIGWFGGRYLAIEQV